MGDIDRLLQRLTVVELRNHFFPHASTSVPRGKAALIARITHRGLSDAENTLLHSLIRDKENDSAHRRRQYNARRTDRQTRRRHELRDRHIQQTHAVIATEEREEESNTDDDNDNDEDDAAQSTRARGPYYVSWQPISIAVRADRCPHCNVWRFVGETATFCCNAGKYLAPRLPSLPPSFNDVLAFPKISQLSRRLNNTFSFTSIGATDGHGGLGFYNQNPPAYVAAHGRVYHRLFAGNHGGEHPLKWYLFDQMDQQLTSAVEWDLPEHVVLSTRQGLFSVNPFIREIRSLAAEAAAAVASIQLRTSVAQGEVSALLCLDNTTSISPREVRIWPYNSEAFTYINSLSPLYEPLQYPLLFPHGTHGWSPPLHPHSNAAHDDDAESSQISQIWLYRGHFLREERFLRFGRLAQEYAVDMFSRVQEARLSYIFANQKRLRQEEAELMGDEYGDLQEHDNIFLPSSFLGGRRWCSNQTADALCLARWAGQPTFFITFTCNPKWPEIMSHLPPEWHLQSHDVPSIAIRVFKLRLRRLLQDLKRVFGAPRYRVHVIEFQKRGLPHAHIAIKVKDPYIDAHEIDSVVSAQLPDDPTERALVEEYMIHSHTGPGGSVGAKDGCRTADGTCRHHYPQPLCEMTHIDPISGRAIYKRLTEQDRWVVPHNVAFLHRHQCHLNFEIAGTRTLFQYLYKYFYKGPDYTQFRCSRNSQDDNAPINEIDSYIKARYICASEALWRIFGFHITAKSPAVDCLPIHLQNRNIRRYQSTSSATSLSKLERYFLRPYSSPFDTQLYTEYYERNVIKRPSHSYTPLLPGEERELPRIGAIPYIIKPRPSHKVTKLARITSLRPSHGEAFYLRVILQHRPVRNWLDARTVGSTVYSTYQQAAIEQGYISEANEGYLAFEEAVQTFRTPAQLRFLFTELISDGAPALPMWEAFQLNMAADFAQRMSRELALNEVLLSVSSVLEERGQSLEDLGLPSPTEHSREVARELERWSMHQAEYRASVEARLHNMTDEQLAIYRRITTAVANDEPLVLFVQARAGRGKTYVVDTICQALRAEGKIVLPTATTALAAGIYAGGRTAHSLYRIPVEDNSSLIHSTISTRSSRADLLRQADLHILDEAPMANKAVPECIDELLRTLADSNRPFGGKRIVFIGDWAQIPPIVRGGYKAATIEASLKSSPLWRVFDVMHLTQPIRNADDPVFAEWVDSLADNDQPQEVDVPFNLLLACHERETLIDFVFPHDVLADPAHAARHAILCPLKVQVAEYNDKILNSLHGQSHSYYSSDSVVEEETRHIHDDPMADIDQLNSMRLPGIPDHELSLKVGSVCVLTRNFSVERNLTKNTKVVVQEMGRRVVVVKVIRGTTVNGDEIIVLPRIDFTHFLPQKGWTVRRRQFPLRLAYATTINSAQGMTVKRLGFDATHPVFSHGQLYTAFSRVPLGADCMVRIAPEQTTVHNVVYTELL